MAWSKTFRAALLLLGLWLPVQALAMACMPCSNVVVMECCQGCPAAGRAMGGSNCSLCAAPLLPRHASASSPEPWFSNELFIYRALGFVQAPLVPPPMRPA